MSNGLTKQHTAKSLLVFALPTIVMMIFMSMYTMIDGIFVANFVSPDALAGLNLVVPFLNILASAAVLVSAGGSVVLSLKLGQGKDKEAKEEFTAIVLLTIGFGAIVTVLGVIMFLSSVVLGGISLVQKILGQALEGFTTVILIQLFSSSIVMISLGIIGYYIARIYEDIKGRPRYIVADRVKGGEHHEAASGKTV